MVNGYLDKYVYNFLGQMKCLKFSGSWWLLFWFYLVDIIQFFILVLSFLFFFFRYEIILNEAKILGHYQMKKPKRYFSPAPPPQKKNETEKQKRWITKWSTNHQVNHQSPGESPITKKKVKTLFCVNHQSPITNHQSPEFWELAENQGVNSNLGRKLNHKSRIFIYIYLLTTKTKIFINFACT